MALTSSNEIPMPKLYALSVFSKTPTEVRLLSSAYDLKKYPIYRRKYLKKFMRSASESLVESAEPETRIESSKKDVYLCYVTERNGFVAILVSEQCPQFFAREIITRVLDEFRVASPDTDTIPDKDYDKILPKYLAEYQQVDKRVLHHLISHYEIVQTKQIMMNNMQAAVDRHDKLESELLDKTEQLDANAAEFSKVSKKLARKHKRRRFFNHFNCFRVIK